jgi:hypothetical protein
MAMTLATVETLLAERLDLKERHNRLTNARVRAEDARTAFREANLSHWAARTEWLLLRIDASLAFAPR